MKKINLALIFGGRSSEREVSLNTGRNIEEGLDPRKFNIFRYDVKTDLEKFVNDAQNKRIDKVFIALHGRLGEDGTIQGLCELLQIPYTGSGVLASALGINKLATKIILQQNRLSVPPYVSFSAKDLQNSTSEEIAETLDVVSIPCVVKPNKEGSSIGVSIVKTPEKLIEALDLSARFDEEIIIEKYIQGKEVTCAILGNENPQALPLIEIRPKNEFFDFEAKYDPKMCEEICPAPLNKKISKKIQKIAINSYKALGCRGFARVDLILDKNNEIFVLEINTIPGLTKNSLFPKAAKASGITFPELLEKIIKLAKLDYVLR